MTPFEQMQAKEAALTQTRLKELLSYDPKTGEWHWRVNRRGPGARIGAKAGCINAKDGRWIGVDGQQYSASRLAYLYVKGQWPIGKLEHQNHDRYDERWMNLCEAEITREATRETKALWNKDKLNPLERMRAKEALLTAEYVRSILDYNPESGELHWKISKQGAKTGELAGTLTSTNYLNIQINGLRYKAHRLAHLIMTGAFPSDEIDHREPEATTDNRWCHIRPATRAENNTNHHLKSTNTSGYKGVDYVPSRPDFPWRAQIRHQNRVRWLGQFLTPELAHQAYAKAAIELHGEFARLA